MFRSAILLLLLVSPCISHAQVQRLSSEPGVLVVTSPDSLQSLSTTVPEKLARRIASFGNEAIGPLLSAAKGDSKIGFWVRWNGDNPITIGFVAKPDMQQLSLDLTNNGLSTALREGGVTEIISPTPVFYKQSQGFVFFAYVKEELYLVPPPYSGRPDWLASPVAAKFQLQAMPQDVRRELANQVASRLTGRTGFQTEEFSPQSLLFKLAKRLCDDCFMNSSSILVQANESDGRLRLSVKAIQERFRSTVNSRAMISARLAPPKTSQMSLAISTRLSEAEVSQFAWWGNSLPEQINHSFEASEVGVREGREDLLAFAGLARDLLQTLALGGEIMGFAALVGEQETQVPMVGVRIPSLEKLSESVIAILTRMDLSAIGIQSAESDWQQIEDFTVHRLVVGDLEEQTTLYLFLAADQLFLTEGNLGLETLKTHLAATAGEETRSFPISAKLSGYSLGSFLGWQEEANGSGGELSVHSQYTPTGVQYDLEFAE